MEVGSFLSVSVQDASQVAEARRIAAGMARESGLSEAQTAKVSLAATEAATNLVKHGGGGEILSRIVSRGGQGGLELIVLDKGPGMHSLEACMRDGYSTAGSPGTGLGAMVRQADAYDIYSVAAKGTAIVLQFGRPPVASEPADVDIAGVAVPYKGETLCGDGWAHKPHATGHYLLISDGLGHGAQAFDASDSAKKSFLADDQENLGERIKRMHHPLKSTRGAAVAVLHADPARNAVRYAGVGNTAGVILSGEQSRHMVSHNGTLGHNLSRTQEFSYDWPPDALIALTTDGIVSQWNLQAYPGLSQRSSLLIAAIIYRDFQRGRDDATAVVVKRKAA